MGDSGVGKTCLLVRFKDGAFLAGTFISTVGIDFRVRMEADVPSSVSSCTLWFLYIVLSADSPSADVSIVPGDDESIATKPAASQHLLTAPSCSRVLLLARADVMLSYTCVYG